MNIFSQLSHTDGKCVIIVTHSKEVSFYADELCSLRKGSFVPEK